MGDPPDCLRRQMHDACYYRRGVPRRQLFQRNGPKDHANLLYAGPQDLSKSLLILAGYLEVDGAS